MGAIYATSSDDHVDAVFYLPTEIREPSQGLSVILQLALDCPRVPPVGQEALRIAAVLTSLGYHRLYGDAL